MRLLLAIVLAVVAGCSDSGPRPWQSRGARVLGLDSERAEDPVTGRPVAKEAAVKREYKGHTYYFESSETAGIFDRDPSPYAVDENVPLNVE